MDRPRVVDKFSLKKHRKLIVAQFEVVLVWVFGQRDDVSRIAVGLDPIILGYRVDSRIVGVGEFDVVDTENLMDGHGEVGNLDPGPEGPSGEV